MFLSFKDSSILGGAEDWS